MPAMLAEIKFSHYFLVRTALCCGANRKGVIIGINAQFGTVQRVYACFCQRDHSNFLYCDPFMYDYDPKSQKNQKPCRAPAKSAGNFLATMKLLPNDSKSQQSAV
jgi:hypothetical protein